MIDRTSQIPHFPPPSNAHLMVDDIWMEVFNYSATSRRAAPRMRLGQVCQRWRRLALSMPHLWNHPPTIYITQESLKKGDFQSGWEDFLARSGNSPLKLYISFTIPLAEIPYRPYGILKPFLDRSTRWEHLTISGLTLMQIQVHLGLVHNNLPCLRSLELELAQPTFHFIPSTRFDVFQFAPKLTSITLYSPSSIGSRSDLHFPWGQLTHYYEQGICPDIFPILISPILETLQCRYINFTRHPAQLVSHINLLHLFIMVGTLAAHRLFHHLNYITLPALNTLSLVISQALPSQAEIPRLNLPAIKNLIVRSSCRLKQFVLDAHNLKFKSRDFISLLSHLGDVETLNLGAYFKPTFPQSTLSKLIFEESCTVLLPRLKSLILIFKSHDLGDFFTTISQIVTSREHIDVDGPSPRQLLVPLEKVCIDLHEFVPRYRAIHQAGGWTCPPEKGLLDPAHKDLTSTLDFVLSPEFDLDRVTSRLREKFVRDNSKPEPEPELIMLFILAYTIEEEDTCRDFLAYLEELGVRSVLQRDLARHRWVPGCDTEILYVHPSLYDSTTEPKIWEAIISYDPEQLSLLLGYPSLSVEYEETV